MISSTGLDRRTFIKVGSLGLAVTALGLAGCATTPSSSSAVASGGSAKGGRTHITMMGLFWLPAEIKAAIDLVKAFNAQSKTVEVQYVQGSWGTIDSKMAVAFSSGDVPDVFHYYDSGLVPWGQNGLLTDLKGLLPAEVWSSINPGTLSSLTSPKNGVLGLPFETEVPVIYYNIDMLKKAGIQPAPLDGRWSWDELRANAKTLTSPDKKIAGISVNWSAEEILFKNGLAWQAGAAPIKVTNGQYSITATDPGTKASVEYLRSILADGSGDPRGFSSDVVASFVSGNAAMLIRGAWARTQIPTVKGADKFKWGVMPFVKGATQNLGSGAAQTLSIPKDSKNKAAAAEFLTWWAKPENIAAICKTSGQIPPNTEAIDLLKKDVGNADFWPEALATAAELNGQPFCPGWLPMLGKVWDPPMFKYLQGKTSFGDFAKKVGTQGTVAVQTAAGNQ